METGLGLRVGGILSSRWELVASMAPITDMSRSWVSLEGGCLDIPLKSLELVYFKSRSVGLVGTMVGAMKSWAAYVLVFAWI